MFCKFSPLKLIAFLLLLASNAQVRSDNKIIYFISPRSLSVAFMRMMEARGDFAIMHEPSQWAFNKSVQHDWARSWFISDAAETFDEVKQRIFHKAKQSPVFVKEVSFAVHQFLLHDHELMNNPNVYFVFLLRNPHHTIISFYNKRNEVENNNIPFAHLVGYQACYEIFQTINAHGANKPYVILSEDLYANPCNTVERFCTHLNIPFKPEALTWQDLGEQFSGQEEWHEIKHKETTQHWHGDAIRSSGFGKPAEYKVDAAGKPTFEEIDNPMRKEICQQAYEENLKYYELLLAAALR